MGDARTQWQDQGLPRRVRPWSSWNIVAEQIGQILDPHSRCPQRFVQRPTVLLVRVRLELDGRKAKTAAALHAGRAGELGVLAIGRVQINKRERNLAVMLGKSVGSEAAGFFWRRALVSIVAAPKSRNEPL